jgi:hypothetical protein
MQCLNLTGCLSLTDTALEETLRASARTLRYLNISQCHRLTDATLALLAASGRDNTTSGCSDGCSDSGGGSGEVNDDDDDDDDDDDVDDDDDDDCIGGGEDSAASGGPAGGLVLEHLDVSGLQLLTDRGVTALSGALPKLRSLGMGHCRRLGTDALRQLVRRCPQLSELKLPFCRNVDAATLVTGIVEGEDDPSGGGDGACHGACHGGSPTIAPPRGSPTTRRSFVRLDFLNLRGCQREPDASPSWVAIRKQNGWGMPSRGVLHRAGLLGLTRLQ